eukprot:5780919-Prymnesium_polylepis.1
MCIRDSLRPQLHTREVTLCANLVRGMTSPWRAASSPGKQSRTRAGTGGRARPAALRYMHRGAR